MTTVIRSVDGVVINIGEWDFIKEDFVDEVTGEVTTVIHNPLPEGAVYSEEEVYKLPDGGLAALEADNGLE